MAVIQIDMDRLSKSSNENDATANGFKLGDDVYSITQYATKPAAAIARLAAGDMLDDKFGGYERITMEDLVEADIPYVGVHANYILEGEISEINFVNGTITFGTEEPTSANPLIYMHNDGNSVIVEVRGVLIHLQKRDENQDWQMNNGQLNVVGLEVYDPHTDIDRYTDFCSDKGIDESTKLGMTILLKQLLVSEGHDIAELDRVLADPQPEALAFYQQIIGPALEAMITLAMTSFKKFAEFIKQIINGSMKG